VGKAVITAPKPGSRRFAPVLAAVAAAFAVVAGPAHAAKNPTIPPPVKTPDAFGRSAFDGDGMWIWYVNKSSGGTVAGIVRRAKQSGIETVFVKSADGTRAWSQFSRKFVNALKARGLRVCAWQYVYGRVPLGEAKAARAALKAGADCFVIDAEAEYEGKYAQAATYMSKLRSYAGARYPIGLAGFPYVDYHPAYPYSVFLGPGGAQFNVPQMYWRAIGVSVDRIFSHTYLYNTIYGRKIAPLGQLWMSPTRGEILRFRQLARAYRAPGVSWWSWQAAPASGWNALARPVDPLAAARTAKPVAPTLRRGSRGDLVVWAQQHLRAARFKSVRVNGSFDTRTLNAVRGFQRRVGLRISGVLDASTWHLLLARQPVKASWRMAVPGSAAKQVVGGRTGPPSAWLPAKANEIPPKPH
jgi:hypothetical protein